MKIHFEPKDFLKALRLVKIAVPKTSFVQALRYVKIHANFKDGAILQATDKEYGIRVRLDVDVSEPGSLLLPVKEVIDALAMIPKGFKATIENTNEGIRVIGDDAGVDWCFASEESIDAFPDVANFTAEAYHEVDEADMLTAIQRTVFAVEKNGVRHALSGVCLESDGSTMYAVATDGRRLAIQEFTGERIGNHSLGLFVDEVPDHQTIVPVNALKLLEKCLKEKAIGKFPYSVKMAVEDTPVKDDDERVRRIITFQYGDVTIFSRLVARRYPKWRGIVPKSCLMHDVTVRNGELKSALKSIAPSFSKNDPHVDLVFSGHRLTFNAIVAKSPYNNAPKEVRGTIEIPCNGYITGKVGVNPKFLLEASSAFSDDVKLQLYLPDGKESDPILIETDGGYSCVMMPLHDSVDMPIIPAAQAERERRESEAKAELERQIADNTVAECEPESNGIDNEDTPKRTTTKNLFAKSELLYINAKNIVATGYEIEDGFVVCKGSQAVVEEAESLRTRFKNVMRIRKSLIEQGILARSREKDILVFTKDHTLDSANIAANVVLGYSGDLGRWKDKDGVSLRKIREQESVS